MDLKAIYYKAMFRGECHHGYQYQDGLNCLDEKKEPFAEEGDCVEGGLYFAKAEDLYMYFTEHAWIREVTLPYDDPDLKVKALTDKFRANKIILGKKWRLSDPKILQDFPVPSALSPWNVLQSSILCDDASQDASRIKELLKLVVLEAPKRPNLYAYTVPQVVRLIWDRAARYHPHDDELISLLCDSSFPKVRYAARVPVIQDAIKTSLDNIKTIKKFLEKMGPLDEQQKINLAYWAVEYADLEQVECLEYHGIIRLAEDWIPSRMPKNLLEKGNYKKLKFMVKRCYVDPSAWLKEGLKYLEKAKKQEWLIYAYLQMLEREKPWL